MTKPGRTYAQIDSDYFNDARVLAAGDAWQVHFAAILLAKRLLTDGRLTRLQLKQAVPESVSDLDGAIGRLLEVGLFSMEGDDIVIRNWHEWNMAASEVTDKRRRASLLANHDRWRHEEKPSSTCVVCQEKGLVTPTDAIGSRSDSDRIPIRIPTASLDRDRVLGKKEKQKDNCANSRDSDSRLAAGLTADSLVMEPKDIKEFEDLIRDVGTVDIFEAVIEGCRIPLVDPPTRAEAKEMVEVVSELHESGATPDDILSCASQYRGMHMRTPTPTELAWYFSSILWAPG
jgi:hypothetical protein